MPWPARLALPIVLSAAALVVFASLFVRLCNTPDNDKPAIRTQLLPSG